MRSKTFGRALGIGVRVAGKALLEEKPLSPKAKQAAEQARLQAVRQAGERGRAAGTTLGVSTRKLSHGTRNVAQGSRNFAHAVWNPFAVASSVLWLEITGMFFALFALFFTQHLYTLRGSWRSGPEHSRFLLYALLVVLFTYFAATSFLRASRKQKRRR